MPADFGYLQPFRRYSRSKCEVVQNWPKFCMFLAPKFFWGSAPEFLEWDYKIRPDSDHMAKFQGDRSRELGERVAIETKKDTSRVKHKPVRNGGSGRPKNRVEWRPIKAMDLAVNPVNPYITNQKMVFKYFISTSCIHGALICLGLTYCSGSMHSWSEQKVFFAGRF